MTMSVVVPGVDQVYNAAADLLEKVALRGAARLLRCEERDCNGDELGWRAGALQRALTERGLEPGDRVLLIVRDTPAFYAGFLGAMRGGFVPIPISTLLPPKDVSFIARDAGVRAALVDTALPEALRDPGLHPKRTHVLAVEGWDIEGASAEPGAAPAPAASVAVDPAFWLYTSGTTGEPKGVVHRHVDLAVTAALYATPVLGMGEDDRVLSAAKLFFAYGLGNSLTFPLMLGADVVLHPERPLPEAMFDLIEREAPTLFFGVPTLYASMLAHPEIPDGLGRVRLCVSAGEALPAVLYERWRERFGVEILDGLGSTEMLHIFLSNRPGEVRPGSSGKPIPGYEARIVQDGGRDVGVDQVGALLAGGPSAALAYHDRPEATAKTMFAPGWLRTGDSYRIDADGYYFHAGRTDDLMKVSGQYVSPVEIEATLAEHAAILEAAVVAQADEDSLTRPKAFVVLVDGVKRSDELAREIQDYVKARLAPHKYPRWVEFVDALPKTATGKIRRFALRKRAS
jgi:benzoate-CoA ligase family protein